MKKKIVQLDSDQNWVVCQQPFVPLSTNRGTLKDMK